MKFGADLKSSVVPEWAPGYIAYDALKAQIKAISGAEADERDALEETFFATLEEELEKVNRFYLQKIGEFDAALAALEARKPRSASGDALGTPATSDHRRNAINLHAQIGQLQAFVWLNTQGFEKIMKKFDKFSGKRHTPGAKAPDFEARLRGGVPCPGTRTFFGFRPFLPETWTRIRLPSTAWGEAPGPPKVPDFPRRRRGLQERAPRHDPREVQARALGAQLGRRHDARSLRM